MKIPVIIGNCVTYSTALELMKTGCDGLLVGIGPGTACTTRGVLGIGVPQVTATVDCAAARDFYFKTKGKYVYWKYPRILRKIRPNDKFPPHTHERKPKSLSIIF